MSDSTTRYILKSVGIDISTKFPTSPISFRKILNHFSNITFIQESLDPETDGMYIRCNKGHFIIVNRDRPLHRRRFSIGHEFGHYILGHDSDITQEKNSHHQSEVEANKFSASILMPSDIMYELNKANMTISEMATWLRVSKIAVAFRCLYLGIREPEAIEVKNAITY